MQDTYHTKRLLLTELNLNDAGFITELVNTPEWIEFIGDRNIRTRSDAKAYIQKIRDNPTMNYWVVRLTGKKTPIGIITFIKRDYLAYYDIGFAFFSEFAGKGYAHEAAAAVLDDIIRGPFHTHVFAVTVGKNIKSIKLLEKLGLSFENEIIHKGDSLMIYAVSVDKLLINELTNLFYSVFTNTNKEVPALEKIYTMCLPETILIRKEKETESVFNITSFIEPRKKLLSDGTLTEFRELQIFEETRIVSNVAQRISRFKKQGFLNGEYFEANGSKLFQYVKTISGWKIAAVTWEDDHM